MTGVSPAQKLRDMIDPRIVGWWDIAWAVLMLTVSAWIVWSGGEVAVAIMCALFGPIVLASDVNEYHVYRRGYALGVLHERNGVSRDPGHPRDLLRRTTP